MVNGGQGRDVLLAALMVGEEGSVVVVDPVAERLEDAKRFVECASVPEGMTLAPVEYVCACGEHLPFDDESIDSVAFNSTFNLAPDKEALLREALRVLVAGGEIYVASVFASKRLDGGLADDRVAVRNLLAGALYIEDFRRMLARLGVNCYRYMDQHDVSWAALRGSLSDAAVKELEAAELSYRVVRTFKIFDYEDLCEKYGQVLTYKGNAPGCEQFIDINDTHRFFTWDPLGVCGNTAAFVEQTRLAKYFEIEGDTSHHRGTYDYCLYCGTAIGETGKLSNMARHLAELDLNRKRVNDEVDAAGASGTGEPRCAVSGCAACSRV
ncbi:methyltransferase domain-containing protein [Xiamenia xianingshaonis]|uniref:methyltransferase domain-containing protein n=1 Tax=Xiamenia xianingshaonis TaxID=2682776 RepID=UPI0021BD39ED|nr:methyltransferase domain-containing protein [Xiamenia xianingshaonis]